MLFAAVMLVFASLSAHSTALVLFPPSLVAVVLLVVGRHLVSVFRSLRDRRYGIALLASLAGAAMLALLAIVAVIFFAQGLTKSADDTSAILLSAVLIYGGGYGLWHVARNLDER